jgi:hypothetical protein
MAAGHHDAPAPDAPEKPDDGRWMWMTPLGLALVAGLLALPMCTDGPPKPVAKAEAPHSE